MNRPTYSEEPGNALTSVETARQQYAAEHMPWLLAKIQLGRIMEDSRTLLEQLGFTIERSRDDLFYEVLAPEGWSKSTVAYSTTVFDAQRHPKLFQFYKDSQWDTQAWLREITLAKGPEHSKEAK